MPLPPKDWPRVRDVFEGAQALPGDRRPAYLTEKCEGDQALRQEVESLLAWDARAESLFDVVVAHDNLHVERHSFSKPEQCESRASGSGR